MQEEDAAQSRREFFEHDSYNFESNILPLVQSN